MLCSVQRVATETPATAQEERELLSREWGDITQAGFGALQRAKVAMAFLLTGVPPFSRYSFGLPTPHLLTLYPFILAIHIKHRPWVESQSLAIQMPTIRGR